MTERDDDTELMLTDPRGDDFGAAMGAQARQEVMVPGVHTMSPRQVGDLFGTLTTAQPVIKERDHGRLMQTLKALASSFGENYVYMWDVNDKNSKRADKKTTIEGPTIQLTNDLAREYGNCALDIREIESNTHWVFYGRFTDLQTGYTLTRAFRQRKNALAGNYENDRKLDMAYQMGQSKCLRNVVDNALRNYAEFMMEESKRALPDKIKADPEKYNKWITKGLDQFGVGEQDAARAVGRPRDEWTNRDMAKVFSALKAISEGLTTAAEAFPKDGPVMHDAETGEVKETGAKTAPKESAGGSKPAAEATAEDGTKAGKLPSSAEADPLDIPEGLKRTAKEPEKAKEAPKASSAPKAEPAKKAAAKKPAALFGED